MGVLAQISQSMSISANGRARRRFFVADFESAVSPNCIPPGVLPAGRAADCKSAIRQNPILRYLGRGFAALRPIADCPDSCSGALAGASAFDARFGTIAALKPALLRVTRRAMSGALARAPLAETGLASATKHWSSTRRCAAVAQTAATLLTARGSWPGGTARNWSSWTRR